MQIGLSPIARCQLLAHAFGVWTGAKSLVGIERHLQEERITGLQPGQCLPAASRLEGLAQGFEPVNGSAQVAGGLPPITCGFGRETRSPIAQRHEEGISRGVHGNNVIEEVGSPSRREANEARGSQRCQRNPPLA
jgi:hypothetical protein